MSRLPFVELRTSELRSRQGVQAVVGVVVLNGRRLALSSVDLDDHPDDDTLRCATEEGTNLGPPSCHGSLTPLTRAEGARATPGRTS
jgi:hypothetical protein